MYVHDSGQAALPVDNLDKLLSSSNLETSMIPPGAIPKNLLIAAVRAYLGGFPHYGKEAAKDEIKIGATAENYFYRVRSEILLETRQINRKRVPYKGWKIPPKKKNESNTDPWAFTMPKKKIGDDPSPKTSIVADSQSVHDCETCGATGHLDCQRCETTGRITCQVCDGLGNVACTGCDGLGTIRRTRRVQRSEKCSSCGTTAVLNVIAILDDNPYSRVRSCKTCGGTGVKKWIENEQVTLDCKLCGKTGKMKCKTCGTKGKVICPSCRGKGKCNCSDCAAQKQVVSYLEITQSHRIVSEETFVPPGWFSEFAQVINPKDFAQKANEPVFEDHRPQILIEEYQNSFRKSGFPNELTNSCAETLRSLHHNAENVGKIADERLTIFRGRSLSYDYKINELTSRAQTTALDCQSPEKLDLLAHSSPASKWLRDCLSDAYRLSQGGESREAALLLRQCKEMAAHDYFCNALFNTASSKFSEKTLELSAKVRFSTLEIIFMAAALLTVVVGAIVSFYFATIVPAIGGVVFCVVFLLIGFVFVRL